MSRRKVDEDGLAAIKDLEEIVGLSVAVGDGEVDGLSEVGLLCAKTYSKEQEREENVEFLHGMYLSRLNFNFFIGYKPSAISRQLVSTVADS
jgi:hypothetical protein